MRNIILVLFIIFTLQLISSCSSYMDWYYTTLPGGKEQHDSMVADINRRNNSFKYDFTYSEWPDGCLTSKTSYAHYDTNYSHRNDNSYVRKLINDFNNFIIQYNAVQYIQGQHYNKGTYVYFINKSTNYSPAIIGNNGVLKPAEVYIIYTCAIWQL